MSLEGRLEDLGLPDIFQIIGLSKRSGVLTIIRKEGSGRLVFHEGQVVYASSDGSGRLGYRLVKKGLISNDDLENALRLQKVKSSQRPVGTILLELGVITQASLEEEIRSHILLVVRDLLSWEKGSFHFELGKVITNDVVLNKGMNTDFLLLEGARLQDEEKEKGVPGDPTASFLPPEEEISPPKKTKTPLPEAKVENRENTPPLNQPSRKGPPEPDQEQRNHRKDLALLTSMIEELSGPSTSSEITLLVLRYASELMNRAIVFLVRKDDIIGLGQFGVVLREGSENERVKSIRIPLNEKSLFKEVVEKKLTYKGPISPDYWNNYLFEELGGENPSEVFAAPLLSDGKVIAILYGDNIPSREQITETEGLEAFIRVAGFAFGKALLERRLQGSKASP